MLHEHTKAVTLENGPRPAGKPDECFYCHVKVGGQHKSDCVLLTRSVVLRYSFDVVVDMPNHWDEQMILSHRNSSSWCADNAISHIEAMSGDNQCTCDIFKAELVREATEGDEARRDVKRETPNA